MLSPSCKFWACAHFAAQTRVLSAQGARIKLFTPRQCTSIQGFLIFARRFTVAMPMTLMQSRSCKESSLRSSLNVFMAYPICDQ
ncbi:hypothetical protein DF038_25680 [Burkholderia cepacia]|nr:hypothetical protein DF038_25680 [Burkholderia cepacia]